MRPALATVVSARRWESDLVHAARLTGLARVVRRCLRPAEVDNVLGLAPTVVVGAETTWLSHALIGRWRAAGAVVVGMADSRAGGDLLTRVGCTTVLDQAEPAVRVLSHVVGLAPEPCQPGRVGSLVAVVGARGSPGTTEVALGLARSLATRAPTLLAETDEAAPALGLRLGLDPGPGLEAADPAMGRTPLYRRVGPLAVLTLPAGGGPLSPSLTARVIEAARTEYRWVVVDAGATEPRFGLDAAVLVVDPSPVGVVRAARLVARWRGDPPLVVVNRLPEGSAEPVVARVRAATGLEPAAIIPFDPHLGREGRAELSAPLDPVVERIVGQRMAAR